MKRICIGLCALCVSVSLIGCSGVISNENLQNESQEELSSDEKMTYITETKEIIFANSLERRYVLDVVQTTNSCQGYGQHKGTDNLLAYVVDTDGSYSTENVVNIIRGLGLMILEDYPYCHYNAKGSNYGNGLLLGECVVVGTYDEICKLFDNTEPIGGALWHLYPAPRPDIADYIKKYSDENDRYEGYEKYEKEIKSEIGEDEEIAFNLSVILPEK